MVYHIPKNLPFFWISSLFESYVKQDVSEAGSVSVVTCGKRT